MLIRLYSETNLLLKNVTFKPGVNIILGRYSGEREARGINGIGKSTLVRLVNYCLLSDTAEKVFYNKKYDFLRAEHHNIVLEFKVQGQTHFIKRNFFKDDKVYLGTNPREFEDYTKGELKKVFVNKFFPVRDNQVFFEGNRFTTIMSFFIKDDLESQQRVDPLNFLTFKPNARDIAIYNFFLFNLPTSNLINFNELVKEYENYNKTVKVLEDKILADTGRSIEEFRSEKIKVEQNIQLLEKSLKDYKFLDNYKKVETELIEVTGKINSKLENYHVLDKKLRKIQDSYQVHQEIDTHQVQKLYNEVLTTFGDLVKKKLDEIQEFKRTILENRSKFLVAKEQQLKSANKKVLDEIAVLEKGRSKLYKYLEEKGALASITNTYEHLIGEKTNLERNLVIIQEVDEIKEILSNLDVTISEVKRDILNDLKQYEGTLNKLRAFFQEILNNTIYLDEEYNHAYFDVSQRLSSQRNQLPFIIDVQVPKVDALGQSRLKIIVYDLMIFLKNIQDQRVFPQFLIHDGVFHAVAHRTIANTLNYVNRQHLMNPNFQYILTFNEDEIDIPEGKEAAYGTFDFDWKGKVIASYEDVPGKMIFKHAFE